MMSKREMKDRVYDAIASVGKAIASPKRLEILSLLTQGEKSVEYLAEQTDLNFRLASAHLKVLKQARLVATRREGKRVFYRASDTDVGAFLVDLRSLAERRFAEIQQTLDDYFCDRETMARIDRKTLVARACAGDITVIDVRPVDEFVAGHIPGAISIPLAELKKRLADIPKEREIIAYCRGPYCVLSHSAVETLRRRGYAVKRLADGVSEWTAAGLPVERGISG